MLMAVECGRSAIAKESGRAGPAGSTRSRSGSRASRGSKPRSSSQKVCRTRHHRSHLLEPRESGRVGRLDRACVARWRAANRPLSRPWGRPRTDRRVDHPLHARPRRRENNRRPAAPGALESAQNPATTPAAPATDVGGTWDVTVDYAASESHHGLQLLQRGNDITGTHRGDFIARDSSAPLTVVP